MATLRTRTLAIIGLTVAALVLVLYGAADLILLRSFSHLERQETKEHAERAVHALDNAIQTLNYEVGDWAGWDESYEFVQRPAAGFVRKNLPDDTFTELRLNVVAFLGTSGAVSFMRWFDYERGREADIPAGFREHLFPGSPLLQHGDADTGRAGILVLPEGMLLLAARPILTTERRGPPAGTLIMGRWLGDTEIGRFSASTRLSISLSKTVLSRPVAPPPRAAAPVGTRLISIVASGSDLISASVTVADLYGSEVLTLRVDAPREIHRQGVITERYVLGVIILVGGVFAAIVIFLLERFILTRLGRLGREVRAIGEGRDVSRRVTVGTADELALFERTLNDMLQALERSHENLATVMRQQQAILDNIPDMVWLKDRQGVFMAVNAAFGEACGKEPERIIGRNDREVWGADLAALYAREDGMVLQTGVRKGVEEYWQNPAGNRLVVETIRSPVLSEDGEIVATTGIARDITERKRMEEALAASEANYRAIFDAANDAIFLHDPRTGAIIDVNRRMCEMYGYTAAEARKCTIEDLSDGSPPYTGAEALERLAAAATGGGRIFEWLARDRAGIRFWIEVNLKCAVIGGEERILAVVRDITERKHLEAELVAMALHDHLTGLPNRNLLQDRLRQMLAAADRSGTGVALVFVDLDRFKQVNDSLGHRIGDLVLKEFSSILLRCVRECDTVARFGGDEFILVLSGIRSREDALTIGKKIFIALERPLLVNGHSIRLGASVGIAIYPDDGADLDTLIRIADAAMYRIKQGGAGMAAAPAGPG